MAKAGRQNKMISKRAEDANNKYTKYSEALGTKGWYELIKVIVDDIANNGTSDSSYLPFSDGNVYLIEAAGYYLGKCGLSETQIFNAILKVVPNDSIIRVNYNLASLQTLLEDEEGGLYNLFISANTVGLAESKRTKPEERPATPTKPRTPQASRASCLEAAAEKLKSAGYLAKTFQYNPADKWPPEFDKGFREYIEAASGGKAALATNPNLKWADVAGSLGCTSDLNGACDAINSDKLTAPIKSTNEVPAATNQTPQSATSPAPTTPEAPVGQDILANILSYMQNTKIAETVGLNLIAEPRRASILIEAAGGVDNAANVLYNKTEGLSKALQPVELTGPITPEWVRRNKPVLQQIVGAINALVSSAVRSVGKLSLLPADRAKAVEKMKSFISQAHQNIQWTKIASKRKDRIRSEVAAEMTVEDKVTARRIKMKESV